MNPGAIFIGLAFLLISVSYVINPLLNERKRRLIGIRSQKEETTFSQVDALAAIRDLDFDFQIGKVTQEDHEKLRAQLVVQAAEVLQKKKEEEKTEEMIRARQNFLNPSAKCEKCGGEIRPQDRFCPTCRTAINQSVSNEQPPQIACPGCGKSVKEADLFCTSCGTRLYKQSPIRNTSAEN